MKIYDMPGHTHLQRYIYGQKEIYLKVKIRTCLKQDLKKLEWFGMFTEDRNIFLQQFKRHLRNENLMLVAELNNFPVGQVWIDWQILKKDCTAVIWALRVHPIMQNQGLGTLMLKNSEHIIQMRNYSYAQLDVAKDNLKAISLYRRLGYRTFAEQNESWSFASPEGKIIEEESGFFKMKKLLQS